MFVTHLDVCIPIAIKYFITNGKFCILYFTAVENVSKEKDETYSTI